MIYRFMSTTGHFIHERTTWEGPEPQVGDAVTLTTVQKVRSGKVLAVDSPRFRVVRRHFIVADSPGSITAHHQIVFDVTPD